MMECCSGANGVPGASVAVLRNTLNLPGDYEEFVRGCSVAGTIDAEELRRHQGRL